MNTAETEPAGIDRQVLADLDAVMKRIIGGTAVEMKYGFARIEFLGETTAVQVVFGAPYSETILGIVALKNVGVAVDPVSKTLKRLPAKPLK